MSPIVHAALRGALLALIALLWAACSGGGKGQLATDGNGATPRRFALELVVRTPAALANRADVDRLVASAAAHGYSAISVLVKQDEDGAIESGRLFYPSALAPLAPGYDGLDVLQATLDAARPRGLKVRAWVPQFHDQVAARRWPEAAMRALVDGRIVPFTGSRHTEYFVNPLDVGMQQAQLAIIRELATRYAVDGVMLDWVRFDDYPMDLGDATRERFHALTGVDPASIDFRADSAIRSRWNDFRAAGIAAYVERVRAALPQAMELGVYILPPDFVEVGQDAARFAASVNMLAPMCYFHDWGFAIDWLWTRCVPSTVAKAGAAGVAPTLDAKLGDDEVQRIVARLRAEFPQIRTLVWFQHGQWTDANLARLARLSNPP